MKIAFSILFIVVISLGVMFNKTLLSCCIKFFWILSNVKMMYLLTFILS